MTQGIFSYNLFETDNLSEYHFILTDKYCNKHHVFVWALSLSDALTQCRNKALVNEYPPPYQIKSLTKS